jgi:alkylhydroperoxidase family enzyme
MTEDGRADIARDEGGRVRLRAVAGEDEQLAAVYAKVQASVGGLPKLYQALANSPAILEGWIEFAWSLRADAESDRGLRELAILRVAQLTGSEYVWRSHWRQALKAGVGESKLHALQDWSAAGLYTEVERAVLAMTDELTTSAAVDDTTWAAVGAALDDRQAVELVMTISWYSCVARTAAALGVPLEDHHARVPGLPGAGTAPGEST